VEVLQIISPTVEAQGAILSVHFLYGRFDSEWKTMPTKKARPIGGPQRIGDQRLIRKKKTFAK